MTTSQMKWAASHDWYEGADLQDGAYTVECRDDMEGDGYTIEFTDFEMLKAWAGY